MTITQSLLVILLVILLLGLAGYYAWRQGQTLRRLRSAANLTAEERRYLRNQVWRRLFGCVLMVVFAGLFAGWFILGIDQLANDLMRAGETLRAEVEPTPPTPEQRRMVYLCGMYLILTLLVLMGLLFTAALDLWAIRGFSVRHRQKIRDDQRALIERQLARLRGEGNGQG